MSRLFIIWELGLAADLTMRYYILPEDLTLPYNTEIKPCRDSTGGSRTSCFLNRSSRTRRAG